MSSRISQLPRLAWTWPLARLCAWYRFEQSRAQFRSRTFALQLGYGILLTALLLFTHSWPAPDLVALLLLAGALLAARGLSFLRDWSPFILLLLGYVALTGLVPALEARTHVGFPIHVDRSLFGGHVPTVWLQAHFYHVGAPRWYDYGATVLYPMHFVVPLVLAFILWMWRADLYWKFVASYLLLCYAGFITYLLYPMAPPWWAAAEGKLPPLQPILSQVHYDGFGNPVVLADRYFHGNPVAAMPSLHAAFPLLVFLVVRGISPRWGWLTLLYPIAMSLAVVYLGEHYVIDVLVGWVYATAAYIVIWKLPSGALPRRLRTLRHRSEPAAPAVLQPAQARLPAPTM